MSRTVWWEPKLLHLRFPDVLSPACLPTLFCCFLSFAQPCFWDACCLLAFCKLAISHRVCCHSNKKRGVWSRGKKLKPLKWTPCFVCCLCSTGDCKGAFQYSQRPPGDPNLPSPLEATSSHPFLTEQLGALWRCPQLYPTSVAAFAVSLALFAKKVGLFGKQAWWQCREHPTAALFYFTSLPSSRSISKDDGRLAEACSRPSTSFSFQSLWLKEQQPLNENFTVKSCWHFFIMKIHGVAGS